MTAAVTRASGFAAVLLCMTSCTGSLFQSKAPASSLYQLSPPHFSTAGPHSAAITADLAVLKPMVRAGLQSDRIAIMYPDRHLDYFADARWSGPLEKVVEDLAVQTFRESTPFRNVSADSSAFASAYWLELEVVDFQAEYSASSAPVIHVRLLARLGSARDRHVLGSFEAESREPAAENRLTAIVAAYEKAAGGALGELATQASVALGEASR